jgi:hypothetical protein
VAVKGYTTINAVTRQLGVSSLTSEQQIHVTAIIEAVEAWIDRRTGRAWLEAPVVDEPYHGLTGPLLTLRVAPISSVQAVTARTGFGQPETALVADTDYEVRSLTVATLWLPGWRWFDRVLVSYTPGVGVPADITHAATIVVAEGMRPALNPDAGTLDSVRLLDVQVKFRELTATDIPPLALLTIDARRRLLVV